jgi:cell wall-associated NlpC family hydrolase
LTALIACGLPCAGATAAPQAVQDASTPPAEGLLARAAQAATVQAIVQRDEERAERRHEVADVVAVALAQVGDGYAWGGSGPDAFDCSGLTAFAFARAGVELPHTSQGQAALGRPVARDAIRPGDLVFFSTAGAGPSHVGIATGRHTVVSATNAGVMEHSTQDAYWGGHYVGARRLAV